MVFLLILLLGLVSVGPGFTYEYSDDLGLQEAVRIAEEDLFEHKKKLSRIQQGLQAQQEHFEQVRREEEILLSELAEIDQKIIEESQLLVSLYNQLQMEKLKALEMEQAFAETQHEKEILARQTEKRLAAYFRMGEIGVLNITFSSATLPDLVSFHEYFRHMVRHDQALIKRFRAKLTEFDEWKKSHERQQAILEAAMTQAKEQQQVLAQAKLSQREILARIKTEKNLYKQAAAELEDSAQALINELEKLEEKAEIAHQQKEEWMISSFPLEPHKKRKPAWMRGFAGMKGLLSSPVNGTVVRLYDPEPPQSADRQPSLGIDFATEPGALVHALFKGKVVHAGFVKGYGQLVIISHNDGYYSMTSGMGTFLVKPDDIVNQGDEIGMVSSHTGRLQETVHLQIRLRTTPEDPLAWLDPSYIVLSPALQQNP